MCTSFIRWIIHDGLNDQWKGLTLQGCIFSVCRQFVDVHLLFGLKSRNWLEAMLYTKRTRSNDECTYVLLVVVWCSSSTLVSINEVNLRWSRLVLRWVTMSGFSYRCRTFISVCNQPPRPTQPSIPPRSVNEDQLLLGRKRQVWFVSLADERGVCR